MILFNNTSGERFKTLRGIRQGDPPSPYIFILCAELLARQLQAASDDKFSGIGIQLITDTDCIPFLTFADNTMIFAKATSKSCAIIKNTIQEYCNMSGQLVNFHKSAFRCTKNVPRNTIDSLEAILGMNAVKGLEKYLGCPIINERVSNSTFQPIVDRTTRNLFKWKANSISKSGKVILIQSKLAATPLYTMQCFMLPKKNLDSLDIINRTFYWNKDPNSKSLNLIG